MVVRKKIWCNIAKISSTLDPPCTEHEIEKLYKREAGRSLA